MKKIPYIILIITFAVVTIAFLTPHKEARTFDDVRVDFTKRFKELSFGIYEQDGNPETQNESIDWIVLEEKDDRALIMSKKTIISISYHNESGNITWDQSLLRLYLNDIFFKENFNDEEKSMILSTNINNSTRNAFGYYNGSNTIDKVFVLNIDEYEKYFENDEERISEGTPYCKSLGLQISSSLPISDVPIENGTFYWTRDVGYHEADAACINWNGEINIYGYDCKSDGMGARPCMWVKKEAISKWQKN